MKLIANQLSTLLDVEVPDENDGIVIYKIPDGKLYVLNDPQTATDHIILSVTKFSRRDREIWLLRVPDDVFNYHDNAEVIIKTYDVIPVDVSVD